MEEVQARHRKELRDLQAKITQKKKTATKKTRKGVNDECDVLERDLKARQAIELSELSASNGADVTNDDDDDADEVTTADVDDSMSKLQISEQSNAPSEPVKDPTSQPSKKPNRQKARLARRAAEQEAAIEEAAQEAANLPKLREIEREKMHLEFTKRGLKEKEVRADGHCLYSSVADQLQMLGMKLQAIPSVIDANEGGQIQDVAEYKVVRASAAKYIQENADDFIPFLDEPLDGYVTKVRDTGEWGGQLELLALAKTYGVSINVLQGDGRVEKIEGSEKKDEKDMWLAYYRHGFGLGEHYNSLRSA